MTRLVTSEEMKNYDAFTIEQIGVPSMVLMEKAALVSVEEFIEGGLVPDLWFFDQKKILCICGAGNNGGDGFAASRLLFLKGMNIEILFVGSREKCSEETSRQYKICENYGIPIHICKNEKDAETIIYGKWTSFIDALFGIGLTRPIEGIYRIVIDLINSAAGGSFYSSVKTLSLDIPSGISADTGEIMGTAVKANKTVTFAYNKVGMTVGKGSEAAGEIIVRDIGITAPDDL